VEDRASVMNVRRLLEPYPPSRRLFDRFEALQYHAGYSGVTDTHLYDPQFPAAITCMPSEAELLFTSPIRRSGRRALPCWGASMLRTHIPTPGPR